VHVLVVRGYPWLTRWLPALSSVEQAGLTLSYRSGGGVLSRVLKECTDMGFRVVQVSVERPARPARKKDAGEEGDELEAGARAVWLEVEGSGSVYALVASLSEFDGVLDVTSDRADAGE
jgi:putative Mg2+ transporter-C (MgtC) family protein